MKLKLTRSEMYAAKALRLEALAKEAHNPIVAQEFLFVAANWRNLAQKSESET